MAFNLQRILGFCLLFLVEIVVVLGHKHDFFGAISGFQPTEWKLAHATFYGDESASETMGGACGYGDLFSSGYGTNTAALSSVLFNNGLACGSCYEMKCVESPNCLADGASITVTATNNCPPNWYQDTNNGGWCNPPREHFDLCKLAFLKLSIASAGIIPVNYRRVPCQKSGGIKLKFEGNDYWLLVYVMNVGGSGDVSQMWVKNDNTEWICMTQNWGASFQAFSKLGGYSLSFKFLSGTTQQTLIINNAVPSDWTPGKTYETNDNYH